MGEKKRLAPILTSNMFVRREKKTSRNIEIFSTMKFFRLQEKKLLYELLQIWNLLKFSWFGHKQTQFLYKTTTYMYKVLQYWCNIKYTRHARAIYKCSTRISTFRKFCVKYRTETLPTMIRFPPIYFIFCIWIQVNTVAW